MSDEVNITAKTEADWIQKAIEARDVFEILSEVPGISEGEAALALESAREFICGYCNIKACDFLPPLLQIGIELAKALLRGDGGIKAIKEGDLSVSFDERSCFERLKIRLEPYRKVRW